MSTLIIISERTDNGESFAASVQFGTYGAPYPITVSNPHSPAMEKQLEWYFEEWLKFPFTDKVRAEVAAKSIRAYGESLFEQVFHSNPDIYLEYRRVREEDFLLEIIGSPKFHVLHWEALQDPNQSRPLAVDKPVVRKNSTPVPYRAKVQSAPLLRVLLVTARPSGRRDVSYRTISRPLVEALETGKVDAQIDIVRPGSFKALVNKLEEIRDQHGEGYYHILHLDMHGGLLTHKEYQQFAQKRGEPSRYLLRSREYAQQPIEPYTGRRAFLFFEDEEGTEGGGVAVSADDLAKLLNMRQIPIVVLNACQSGKQVGETESSLGSRLVGAGVQLVVAMGYSVTVSAARMLMTLLYRQLLEGRNPAVAIRRARLELFNDKQRQAAYNQEIALEDWVLPVIYQNEPLDLTFTGTVADTDRSENSYAAPKSTYGFVGRDIDILEIERHLLNRRNVLLIQGMGGAGKTTLLHHIGWWWQKTRFVEKVFYFGYDVKACHLAEMVNTIGHQLGLKLSGILSDDRKQVVRLLKSNHYLLILDNMESITGEPLAVPNTLPAEAQQELRNFLDELVGGKSFVLLGSRSREKWLQPQPLRELDIYYLPGLDAEAQTILAEAILKETGAPRYPELEIHRDAFMRLLKLLGGYPLAMEVVLGNLAHATPAEVIERLEAADVNLDNQDDTATKTESILKCIEYSHSNLSEETQKLLLCLAPFTGVINQGWLKQYTELLKNQILLADLSYHSWQEVLQEAQKWGLLKPHETLSGMGYLSLQPVFPYFLRTRLNQPEHAERKKAIECAFREHYEGIGAFLVVMTESKESSQQQNGYLLIELEYENLYTVLHIALKQQKSFFSFSRPISVYLNKIQRHQQGLELGKLVLETLETYPKELLQGQLGDDLVSVLTDDIGTRLLNLRQFPAAQEAYEKALKVHEALTELSPERQMIGKGDVLSLLGTVACYQEKPQYAERFFKDALYFFTECNAYSKQAKVLHQLGVLAEQQNLLLEAASYFKEVLKINIKLYNREYQVAPLHHLGRLAHQQGKWHEAERYLKEALEIEIEYNDGKGQAKTLHQLGGLAIDQGYLNDAEWYYKEALKILIQYNDLYTQAKVLYGLGKVSWDRGLWHESIDYILEAMKIYVAYPENKNRYMTLCSIALFWKSTNDTSVIEKLSTILNISTEECEALLKDAYESGINEKRW